ncbi:MAG: ABC transporter ATP-binding protein [Myxococcota bacterium]
MSGAVVETQKVLEIQKLHHWFGPKLVLHDINLEIARGQIVSIVGPSGCGKSTLFRAIIGTHPPRRGEIVVTHPDGSQDPVRGPGRDRGIVYQNYALFEFLTVLDNVAFGPMLDETTPMDRWFRRGFWKELRKKHHEKAYALLERVGLAAAAERYPHELSGGMRQRVAIAQALIMEPDVLLLDEPFGALDEATREDLQRLLLQLYADNVTALQEGRPQDARTILMVTHELTEAIFVSDRVVGLSQYLDWNAAGHKEHPGATVVYDKAARVYNPDDAKQHEDFVKQREELHHAVFDTENLQRHDAFVEFWHNVYAGARVGVLDDGAPDAALDGASDP